MSDRIDAIRKRRAAITPGGWEEEWKVIPGTDGMYEASTWGNIRSYYRKGNFKEKRNPFPYVIKTNPNPAGYLAAGIRKDGPKFKTCTIHSLVAETFLGPRPEGMEVAHLNGDKTDNRVANLQYCTHQENEDHKDQHGTRVRGERVGNAKL